MIKANELRRDNLLFQKSRGININIDNPHGLHQITVWGVDWPIEDFEPVALTPEWLESVGLNQNTRKKDYYSIPGLDYDIKTNRVWIRQNENSVRIDNIQYVHQLQNLYFALTGEELTIKETA